MCSSDLLEQLKRRKYKGQIAAIAEYPDQLEGLLESGVDAAFNIYSEAGHVGTGGKHRLFWPQPASQSDRPLAGRVPPAAPEPHPPVPHGLGAASNGEEVITVLISLLGEQAESLQAFAASLQRYKLP